MGKRERTEDYFRKRLKSERLNRQWSQADVAKLLSDRGIHMHPTTVAKIEAGERSVRIDEATGIADLFEVSLDALLGRAVSLDDDLGYALRSLRHAARRWDAQLGPMGAELDDAVTEILAFDFDGREELLSRVSAVARNLALVGSAVRVLEHFARPSSGEVSIAEPGPDLAQVVVEVIEEREGRPLGKVRTDQIVAEVNSVSSPSKGRRK